VPAETKNQEFDLLASGPCCRVLFHELENKRVKKIPPPTSYLAPRTKTPVTCTLAPSAHWLFLRSSVK